MRITSLDAIFAGNTGNTEFSEVQKSTFTPLLALATDNKVDNYTAGKVKVLPLEGSTDPEVLAKAPSCEIVVNKQKKKAVIVVDLASCTLYKYDKNGNPKIAYSIAKGKPSTPTHIGIRMVSHGLTI